MNLRIEEIPTTLSPDGRSRPPHLRSWRDGWRHLRFMLLYSPKWLFLIPGILLMLVGALLMAWLLPGPRTVGRITLDVDTLVYAGAFTIVGLQSVLFALFTKVFAITTGLLPEDKSLKKIFQYVTLESGVIAGAVLLAAGLALSVQSLQIWKHTGFGDLKPSHVLRTIIPAVVCLITGCQVILGSFFFSVLGLPRR